MIHKILRPITLLLFFLNTAAATAEERKNILFLLVDDQRNDVLGCYGNPLIQTPTIDRLASEGVRFDNFFCQVPICAASRAGIITGLTQLSHGFNFGEYPVPAEFIPTSYPALLKKSGYRTGFTGKYGFRFSKDAIKEQFDFYKHYHRSPYLHKMPDGSLRHETDLCADAAVEFIRTNPEGTPFCISVSFNATHAEDGDKRPGYHFQWPSSADGLYEDLEIPLPRLNDPKYRQATPAFLQKKSNLSTERYFWRWDTPEKYQINMRAYYRMATGVDHAIARIIDELKARKLDQNTLIIYTADNGFMLGDRGMAGKWNHYEQSLRVPFIVYDPSLPEEQRGRVVTELGTLVDVAPTIAEAAGLKPPEIYQGRSLMKLVEGRAEPEWRDTVYLEHYFHLYNSWYGLRSKRYKYALYHDESDGPYECLYDLEKDPDELVNLANNPEYAPVKKRLAKQLEDIREQYPHAPKKTDPSRSGK